MDCSALDPRSLRVLLLSSSLVEEAGGPGVAAAGYAAGLATRGVDVTVVALRNIAGTWLVDETSARSLGYRLIRLNDGSLPTSFVRMTRAVLGLRDGSPRRTIVWANGIWGAQSLTAAALGRRFGWPYIVRPAGSLGIAALRYRRLKKLAYYVG